MAFPVDKIISGGQSGADRAVLDVALELGIPAGGWCPAGRRAEDGVIAACYPLTETKSPIHSVRTRRNVCEADGKLVFNLGELDSGTLLTVEYARERGRPCLLVQLDEPGHPVATSSRRTTATSGLPRNTCTHIGTSGGCSFRFWSPRISWEHF